MSDTIIVAILSLIGTLAGSYGGSRLMLYRLEQLEKKVEKHNSVIERTYALEKDVAVVKNDISVANHRISDLEEGK